MELTKKAKEELENRIDRLERYIEEKGLGSSYLNRAKKVQRGINVGLVVGSVLTVAGLTIWALSKSKDSE